MSRLYGLDEYRHRNLAGLSLAEKLEFEALERSAFSLEEWDAYSMSAKSAPARAFDEPRKPDAAFLPA